MRLCVWEVIHSDAVVKCEHVEIIRHLDIIFTQKLLSRLHKPTLVDTVSPANYSWTNLSEFMESGFVNLLDKFL